MKGDEQESFCGDGPFDHPLPHPAGRQREAQWSGLNQPQGASPMPVVLITK